MSDALLFREHEVEQVDEWSERLGSLGRSSLLWIDLERPRDAEVDRLAEALELAAGTLGLVRIRRWICGGAGEPQPVYDRR